MRRTLGIVLALLMALTMMPMTSYGVEVLNDPDGAVVNDIDTVDEADEIAVPEVEQIIDNDELPAQETPQKPFTEKVEKTGFNPYFDDCDTQIIGNQQKELNVVVELDYEEDLYIHHVEWFAETDNGLCDIFASESDDVTAVVDGAKLGAALSSPWDECLVTAVVYMCNEEEEIIDSNSCQISLSHIDTDQLTMEYLPTDMIVGGKYTVAPKLLANFISAKGKPATATLKSIESLDPSVCEIKWAGGTKDVSFKPIKSGEVQFELTYLVKGETKTRTQIGYSNVINAEDDGLYAVIDSVDGHDNRTFMPFETAEIKAKLLNDEKEIPAEAYSKYTFNWKVVYGNATISQDGSNTCTFTPGLIEDDNEIELRVEVRNEDGALIDRASEYFNVQNNSLEVTGLPTEIVANKEYIVTPERKFSYLTEDNQIENDILDSEDFKYLHEAFICNYGDDEEGDYIDSDAADDSGFICERILDEDGNWDGSYRLKLVVDEEHPYVADIGYFAEVYNEELDLYARDDAYIDVTGLLYNGEVYEPMAYELYDAVITDITPEENVLNEEITIINSGYDENVDIMFVKRGKSVDFSFKANKGRALNGLTRTSDIDGDFEYIQPNEDGYYSMKAGSNNYYYLDTVNAYTISKGKITMKGVTYCPVKFDFRIPTRYGGAFTDNEKNMLYIYDGSRNTTDIYVKSGSLVYVFLTYNLEDMDQAAAMLNTSAALSESYYGTEVYYSFKVSAPTTVTTYKKEHNSIDVPEELFNEDGVINRGYSEANQSFSLDAKANDAKLTYKSDNKNVKVSTKGKVTINKKFFGTANITITSADTKMYFPEERTVTITMVPVDNPITAKDISKAASATKDQIVAIGAKVKGKAPVSYTSDNENIAVSEAGKVTLPAGYVGKANITIHTDEVTGYNATDKVITVMATPAATKLATLKNVVVEDAPFTMKATWAANTTVDKYEIQYSTSKKFADPTETVIIDDPEQTEFTVSDLQKKTYYVRIRGIKVVDGEDIPAAWSAVKYVAVKK